MANYLEDGDRQPSQLRYIVFIQSYEIHEKHKWIKVEESGFYYSFPQIHGDWIIFLDHMSSDVIANLTPRNCCFVLNLLWD